MADRTVKGLNYELREQVTIYFEEGLFVQGLEFLTSLLSAGVASDGTLYLPPPSHIALLATLSIHPNFTNKAKDQIAGRASILASRYLRLLNQLVNPVDAQLAEALSWPDISLTRRGGLGRRRQEEEQKSTETDASAIRLSYARDRSIFWKTTDFWAAAGWAFRCSLLHPVRWALWQNWLEFMLDALEHDFQARKSKDDEAIHESIIAKYVRSPDQRSRILRAIFADDSDRFVNEFPEVWRNETQPRTQKKPDVTTIQKIDVENDQFGDYLDVSTDDEAEDGDDTEQMEEEADPSPRKVSTGPLGSQAAVKLRMRLLGVMVQLSDSQPKDFGDIWTLFNSCLEYVRPLPISLFSIITSPPMLESFPPSAALSWIRYLAHSLMQTGAKVAKGPQFDQGVLVKSYLPYTANTNIYVDNAKFSICLEVLMRILDLQDELRWNEDLEYAVEKGIEKREDKATTAKGKKGEATGGGSLGRDKQGLEESAMRLRMLVHLRKTVDAPAS